MIESKSFKFKQFLDRHVWGLFSEPSSFFKFCLSILPFLLIIWSYSLFSTYQTSLDAKQKVYPSYSDMFSKIEKYLLSPDKRLVAVNSQNINKDIELKNSEITKNNLKRVSKNEKEIPLIPLYTRDIYKEWVSIKKELKSMDKEFENEKNMALFFEITKLKLKSYIIGFPNSLLVNDTLGSLYRLTVSMVLASSFALIIGLYMGTYKTVEYTLNNFVTMFSLIQPVAILPIIMIVFGVEDYGKIIYISIGVFPAILLGLFLKIKSIPNQTIVKAKTLGAKDYQTIFKVVLPQIFPHFIDIVRLTLFLGWILLLTSEMVSSESGLGFRILLEKRFINMDVIIPYVIWIVMISFMIDRALIYTQKKLCPWYKTR